MAQENLKLAAFYTRHNQRWYVPYEANNLNEETIRSLADQLKDEYVEPNDLSKFKKVAMMQMIEDFFRKKGLSWGHFLLV